MARVLVVEDDKFSRIILVELLRHEGHDVREAVTGEQALEELGRECPEVVVLDMLLPGVLGLQVVEAIRAANLATKIIAVSGSPVYPIVPADAFLLKPFDNNRLLELIRGYLSEAREPG